ncbi:MAG: hypothetical protein IPG24_19650 [Leptospiraceae bacterium]|nr:hypothetical protein [Leptospiraceae bacterium]
MSIVTLELKNDLDLELLIAFAQRLDVAVLSIHQSKQNRKRQPVYWLEELAKIGGVKSIPNPSEWQKQVRTDKPLFGRE